MNFHLAINPASTSETDLLIGRIEFSPEEQAGRIPACIEVTASTCTAPDCDCGDICLNLPPLDPGAPVCTGEDKMRIPRLIAMSTEFREAEADFFEVDEPILHDVGEMVPRLLREEHWDTTLGVYREIRTRMAETCDIATFGRIPECLRRISDHPEAKDVEASLRDLYSFPFDTGQIDGTQWFFEEFYPVPNTPSPLWVTIEFRITKDGLVPDLTPEQYEDVCDDPDGFPEYSCPTVKLRWILDTGEISELSRTKTDLPIHRFLDLLLEVHPDARERFRRRHQHLVQSIARIPAWLEANPDALDDDDDFDPGWLDDVDLSDPASLREPGGPSQPTVRATPKVGRNDPCPCGSGKKFKKCCGG